MRKLQRTICTAMRMLDNVIDLNYYAVKKARDANLRHRPVGLGVMAFQDCLYALRIPYASEEAVEFRRPLDGGSQLLRLLGVNGVGARERGDTPAIRGSLWDQGVLPQDTPRSPGPGTRRFCRGKSQRNDGLGRLAQENCTDGMCNSNCVAIAPTATISNIIGVDASIEPNFGNLSVKSNLSGEFTVTNAYLVRDLKQLGLWDDVMVMDLKHFDGSLASIDRVPADIKRRYATAFEIDPLWLIEAAARRQKWIDQAQSLNLYIASASGKKLDETTTNVCLAAGTQNHVLLAYPIGHPCRKIHGETQHDERRVSRRNSVCTRSHTAPETVATGHPFLQHR